MLQIYRSSWLIDPADENLFNDSMKQSKAKLVLPDFMITCRYKRLGMLVQCHY